eukprot:5936508-Pleurochrysis_carterae.AAC.2
MQAPLLTHSNNINMGRRGVPGQHRTGSGRGTITRSGGFAAQRCVNQYRALLLLWWQLLDPAACTRQATLSGYVALPNDRKVRLTH